MFKKGKKKKHTTRGEESRLLLRLMQARPSVTPAWPSLGVTRGQEAAGRAMEGLERLEHRGAGTVQQGRGGLAVRRVGSDVR